MDPFTHEELEEAGQLRQRSTNEALPLKLTSSLETISASPKKKAPAPAALATQGSKGTTDSLRDGSGLSTNTTGLKDEENEYYQSRLVKIFPWLAPLEEKLRFAHVQLLLIGVASFCEPGLFNAIIGLGGGGSDSTETPDTGMASVYLSVAVFGLLSSYIFQVLGPNICIALGSLSYVIYCAVLYTVTHQKWTHWILIPAGLVLGVGSTCFHSSTSALMLAYSTDANRGQYISAIWVIFNFGGFCGGLITLGLNFAYPESTVASATTYFCFLTLMLLGAVITPPFLVNQKRVIRADGSPCPPIAAGTPMEEIKGAAQLLFEPIMLQLAPYFFASNWYYTYCINFLNHLLFNIRSRGFNSAIFWGAQMISAFIFSTMLDRRNRTQREKGMTTYFLILIMFTILWVGCFALQYRFEDRWDKDNGPSMIGHAIDLTASARCTAPIALLIGAAIVIGGTQSFSYWLLGAFADTSAGSLTRYSAFYKVLQSSGGALAWSFNFKLMYRHQLWGCVVLWLLSSAFCFFAVTQLNNDPVPVWNSDLESFSSSASGSSTVHSDGSVSSDYSSSAASNIRLSRDQHKNRGLQSSSSSISSDSQYETLTLARLPLTFQPLKTQC